MSERPQVPGTVLSVCTAPSLHHACLKKALENPHLMDAETEVTRVKYISKGTELVGLELGLSNCDFTMLTADLTAPARTGSGGTAVHRDCCVLWESHLGPTL